MSTLHRASSLIGEVKPNATSTDSERGNRIESEEVNKLNYDIDELFGDDNEVFDGLAFNPGF